MHGPSSHRSPVQRHVSESQGAGPLYQPGISGPGSPRSRLFRSQTAPGPRHIVLTDDDMEGNADERAREVVTGRLIQGHIVDDDFPSPMLSTGSGSISNLARISIGPPQLEDQDPMSSPFFSTVSSHKQDNSIGEVYDQAALSDHEDDSFRDPDVEHTVTLVGNVSGRTVFIIDDMMDVAESWIAAAETVVKRGAAKKVYCIATHGLFGDRCLEEMEECECIDCIVVSNTFPIDPDRALTSKKLVVLDLSGLLAEAIRRHHHGENISQLYQYYRD
jgi:ribose-phosphate pyrophosphokinase